MKLNQYEWDPEKDKIGEGTFAEVFKAKDIYANRHVALKIYKTSVKGSTTGSTGQSKYSLEQEFQKIQDVSHTNIITYYGLNYIKHIDAMGREGSHPVIIMEYANQGTLTEFLRTKPKREVLDKLIIDIIAGVGHLHEEGIIHRDHKPGNILVTKNKRGIYTAKITDFGISKDTLSSDNLTKSHTELVGTPHYMAPEQISQKKYGLDGRISSRTDLWAIGVIIYKTFTGRLPFANGVHDIELVRDAIIEGEFDLTGVPAEYHKLLALCFKKNAKERVSTASDMKYLIGSEGTIDLSGEKEEKEAIQENSDVPPSKTQKIVLGIFGLVNLLWLGYYWFPKEDEPYFYLIYPLTIVLFCFFYLKPQKKFAVPRFLSFSFVIYYNLILITEIAIGIYNSVLNSKDIILICLMLIFQTGLSFWLILKQLKNKNRIEELKKTNGIYFFSTSIIAYLISYFLFFSNDISWASILLFLRQEWREFLLLLFPNTLFITTSLFFIFKMHRQFIVSLSIFFIVSIGVASIWWLELDAENGYKILLTKAYMQELKSGYYLWFFSIFIGFSVILYDAVKGSKFKKAYWPILGVLILTLGITFNVKWSSSENVYNFNRGVENIDYKQFKKAFDHGKPLNVNSNKLQNFVKNILTKYTNENAGTVKSMLKLFVNSNGLVTYIKDADLANAITKNDTELLEILLKPTGSTRFEDVDFVHEDKSLLKMAQDIKNPEIEKLLVDAGAKLTKAEKESEEKAKMYSFKEDFTNGSTVFSESNDQDGKWSFGAFTKNYMLTIKNENKSYLKSLDFTKNLDKHQPYNLSVKIQRKAEDFDVGVGLVFDSNGKDYHISIIRGDNIYIYKFQNNNWIEIYKTPVIITSAINTMAISKSGDYISFSINGNRMIHNLKINSIGGLNMGVICSNPIRKTTVFFDDFKVTGTKK